VIVAFILLAAVISIGVLTLGVDTAAGKGVVFPEAISLFTLRSFAVSYAAVTIAALPLLWVRGVQNALTYAYASLGLMIPITAAALIFIDRFDLQRFGHAFYIGVYLVLGAIAITYLWKHRGAEPQSEAHGS
jgi:hypothetical protein